MHEVMKVDTGENWHFIDKATRNIIATETASPPLSVLYGQCIMEDYMVSVFHSMVHAQPYSVVSFP